MVWQSGKQDLLIYRGDFVKRQTTLLSNVLCVLYYAGLFVLFLLLNLLLTHLQERLHQTFEIAPTVYLSSLAWLLGGGYLWLSRFLKPHPIVQIICKAVLFLSLFFGCVCVTEGYLPILDRMLLVRDGVAVTCGYLFFSMLYDIVEFIRAHRKSAVSAE